jgi:glutamyl-tRNA(Gln) amidotransferase subunit E
MDYEKIGLVSGIEIHQQLEGKKLFCNCPTEIREDTPDIEIKRKLKAVVGETGEVDIAAAHESEKAKTFTYQAYSDTTCLVELDEEPPHQINKGAVNLTLQICKFLQAHIVDEIQVMRKTVVDGSNTTGFQRTALIGINGSFEISGKKISIPTISLEEDAAKIVSRSEATDTYNLSRLGIPLIEIGTGPDLQTPAEVAEAAEKLGMFLRSTTASLGQSVKRGLGTIRQDVNVSIKGGARIEIKGAQDLKIMKQLVENEAIRQQWILENKKKICVEYTPENITHIFLKTECKFINTAINKKQTVFGSKVTKGVGKFIQEIQPGKRFGTELSDFAKVRAGIGGIIHSDEDLTKYSLSEKEITEIKQTLRCRKDDAFVIIVGDEKKCKEGFKALIERSIQFAKGVPKEVRKANPDATTTYMRPMPGGARMYPETDVLPIKPNFEIEIGETVEERSARYIKEGVKDKDIAMQIARNISHIFEEIRKKVKLDSNTIAANLINAQEISTDDIIKVLIAMNNNEIPKNAFNDVISDIRAGKDVTKAIASRKSMSDSELEKIVDEVLKKERGNTNIGLLMGKVMAAAKGKADGKKANELLRKKING